MSKRESAKIYTIWTNVIIEGENAKVCIIGGMAKILYESCGFDIPIPGKYHDVSSVVRAHLEQQKMLKQALDNQSDGGGHATWDSPEGADISAALGLPDDAESPRGCMPKCLSPISEDELDSLTVGMKMVEDLGDNGKD